LDFECSHTAERIRHQADFLSPLQELLRLGVIGVGRDAAEKLNAYEAANAYQVDPEIEQFLELLQQAA
jgi:hypothetical protein